MSKQVISVRLTAERLAQLDQACKQLGMNRSEAIDEALRLLPVLISGKAELQYHPENRPPGPPARSVADIEAIKTTSKRPEKVKP